MQSSFPPIGGPCQTQFQQPTVATRNHNTRKCTECRLRKKACVYVRPDEICQHCNDRGEPCGRKILKKEDLDFKKHNADEKFFSEIRQLIEERIELGDTPDNIRRLLDIEDHPPPLMRNQYPLTVAPPPLNENILQHETLYPDNAINEQWNTNISSMQYLTNPITTYTPAPLNSTTYPGQFAYSNLDPNVSLNTGSPYSLGPPGGYGAFSSNEHPSTSLGTFQSFEGNYLSQAQPFVDSSNGFYPFPNPSGSQSK